MVSLFQKICVYQVNGTLYLLLQITNQMRKLLIGILLTVTFCMQAQTYVNIPFKQPQVFTVSADSVVKTIVPGQTVDLGGEIEINGGSGKYNFVWTNAGTEVSTSLLLNVNSEGEYILKINDGAGCKTQVVYIVKLNTGLDKTYVQQINIYPIPAGDFVFIRPLNDLPLKSVAVYNPAGELIRSEYYGYDSGEQVRFGLEGLPAGQYLLTCDFVDKKITRVIVKK